MEHIKSEKLINKLDAFLGFPTLDPHGDPIPDIKGETTKIDKKLLSEAKINVDYICVGVKNSAVEFLKYLNNHTISLGSKIKVISKEVFDASLTINLNSKIISISNKIAENLFIKEQ